ncbi:hypothetical protein AVEN_254160-1 [Araneus ventricosus]|uniref:Integrase catalytic domain-containing protein n=1 Tax=Araneus ventricosus TaxID=182803 RepID=A0A4Y2JYE9_ARAVE|nr:hypothetical protein AVEN_254160-1 [Araneus ventricosus]
MQKTHLGDPAIKPILEKKLNSEDLPYWHSGESCNKTILGSLGLLTLKDGVIYRKLECDDGRSCRWPLILTKRRIQRYNVGAPFERMALDILGPFPVTTKGNRYVLVLLDYFTKWPKAIPIPDQKTSDVAEELARNWISCYGKPILLY